MFCYPQALTLSGKTVEGTHINVEAMNHTHLQPSIDNTWLFLYNLNPERVTEDYLRGIFMKYGTIEHIKVIRDVDTGQSFGFGFIKVSRCVMEILYGIKLYTGTLM